MEKEKAIQHLKQLIDNLKFTRKEYEHYLQCIMILSQENKQDGTS